MKTFIPFVLIILFAGPLMAQSLLPDRPHTVLWKVTAPSGKVSHILGSNHLFGEDFLNSIPGLKNMIQSAHRVISESGERKQENKVFTGAGATDYDGLYTAAQTRVVDSFLAKHGMNSLHELDSVQFPISMLMVHAIGQLITEKNPAIQNTGDGMDVVVEHWAKEKGIPLIGLDSGMQVREEVLNFGADNVQIASDLYTLITSARSGTMEGKDFEDYKRCNLNYEFNKRPDYTGVPAFKHLLTDRNTYWMKRLPGYLNASDCFVVVGNGHLKFKDGLLNQLKNNGFIVKPVKM